MLALTTLPFLGGLGHTERALDYSFDVAHLSIDRLMSEWRWLCPQPMTLVARTAFGDLFLRDASGKVSKLNVSAGQLTEVSES
jgi:hypothetical protein